MDQVEVKTIEILRELGIPAHVKGYVFIKSAVAMVHEDNDVIYSMTKVVYPKVAEIHGTLDTRVERSIRHAISISKADDTVWWKTLGRTLPMTNVEFLAAFVEELKLRLSKKETA